MALSDADMVEFGPATVDDVPAIVALLSDDELGQSRESGILAPYLKAFEQIDADPNHLLAVGRFGGRVVCCVQLTVLPCMTHGGSTRGQIEGVRVHRELRGRGIGYVMMWWVIEQAKDRDCDLLQLTTDRRRAGAERFYEKHGFATTHHGMKLSLSTL